MKLWSTFIFLLLIFLLIVKPVNAETIFEENFDDGNADGWNIISGNGLWRVQDGKYGARIETPSTEIISVAGAIPLESYAIELDINPVAGEDKNIVFRWKDYSSLTSGSLYHYSAHFNNDFGGTLHLKKYGSSQNGWPITAPFSLSLNQTYRIKVILRNQKVELYVNNVKLAEGFDLDYIHEGDERVMLYISTGASFPTEIWFDNIKVSSIDEDENTELNVPLIKQTSEPWQAKTYDSANKWSPINPTINRWGCALTSAVMVLQYHGITKMPNGQPIDPDTLNSWLLSQSDGYISNGLVNWLAISRLSKIAKASGQNPEFNSDALEYARFAGGNLELLLDELNNGRPPILEQPGHFIVAKGTSGDTYSINDPYYSRTSLNDGYNNSYLSLGQYRPSNTDLSYIMLVATYGVQLELSDTNGNIISDMFMQNPIIDPVTNLPSGSVLGSIYLQQPLSDSYTIKLTSPSQKSYELTTYLYDVDGNVKVFKNTGVLAANGSKHVQLLFDKDNIANSTVKKDVTFQSIIDYINTAIKEKKVNKTSGKLLINALKAAEKTHKSKKYNLTKMQLSAIEALLHTFKKTNNVSNEAFAVISADLKELKATL